MARKSPNVETLKLLYVRSGNECAFPNCEHPIFNDDGLYITELCHIKGANKGSARYDEYQTDEERRLPENLLFMCHRHHKETDDESQYTVDVMIEMKAKHESRFNESGKKLSKKMLSQVILESELFWSKQASKLFDFQELKITRDFDKDIFVLFEEVSEILTDIQNYCDMCAQSDSPEILLEDLYALFKKIGVDNAILNEIPYWENPFQNRNWEMHNIGSPNLFSHISLSLSQLKIKVAEEILKNQPENLILKKQIDKYRDDFNSLYENAYYYD